MFLINLVKILFKHDVDFAIAGGYAVVLHGVTRGTVDVDFVLNINAKNFERAETALRNIGLQPRLPITHKDVFSFRKEYIEKRNLIAWSFLNPKDATQIVDVIITHDLSKMEKTKISLYGLKVPVLSKKSLIRMKKEAGRPQDLEDIRALEDLREKK